MAAVAAPNLLVFNHAVNGMITEANNMSTTVQNYAQHQQTMGQQLQLIGNQPFGPILQNLTNAVQALTGQIARLEAKIDNQNVIFRNSKVYESTANLRVPYSLNANVNAQVAVGNPIPNFPQTPALLMTTGLQDCRRILTALAVPWQNNQTVSELRLQIRDAIGLPAL